MHGGGPEAFATFVIKTMTFVSEQLQASFPADTGLRHARQRRRDLRQLHGCTRANGFSPPSASCGPRRARTLRRSRTSAIGGFYVVPHPTVPDRDLIVLNTVLWSMNYQNRCNPAAGDPGAAQLAWLEWTLYRTKLRGRTASLLFHIPPGIDGYSSSHGSGTCRAERHAVPEGSATKSRSLRCSSATGTSCRTAMPGTPTWTIFACVATAAGEPILLTHITPAISPIYRTTRASALVLYDRTSGDLIDYATVYLTNLAAPGVARPARWAIEYTFRDAYGYTAYDPRHRTSSSRRRSASDAAVRDDYVTFYPVTTASTNPPIDQQNWKAYRLRPDRVHARGVRRLLLR